MGHRALVEDAESEGCVGFKHGLGCRGFGFRGSGFRGLGCRGLGLGVYGFRV